MIRNSKIIPYAELANDRISIRNIARSVILFYRKLIVLDEAFACIYIISDKKSLHRSIAVNCSQAINKLAAEILLRNKEDIIKIDKVDKPDIDFERIGNYIHFSLAVEKNKAPLLTLSFSFIQSDRVKSKIGTIAASSECFKKLEDCIFFLKTIKNSFPIEYASMKVSFFERDINKEIRRFKAPLGIITYFSDKKFHAIPNDLSGIEYMSLDEGRLLILEDVDVFNEDCEIRLVVLRLLDLMKQIEAVFPEYLKKITPPST